MRIYGGRGARRYFFRLTLFPDYGRHGGRPLRSSGTETRRYIAMLESSGTRRHSLVAELDALGQRQVRGPVQRVGLASHVGLPGVGAGFAAAAGFLFAAERAADLGAAGADVDVGDAAVAAGGG